MDYRFLHFYGFNSYKNVAVVLLYFVTDIIQHHLPTPNTLGVFRETY